MADFQGIIVIHKEKGFTSHDVVAKLRGILHMKKIGHTGTLDPDATGVLPVALGKGTKLVDLLTDKEKTYEAVLHLGIDTDTQDMSGTVLEERPVNVTEEEVRKVLKSFVGEQLQVPPMYSALKVNGKKLYELAREGKTVERKARPVCFYEIEPLEFHLPLVKIRVTCSKGTYIRTLCHDIGEKLGCGGCMEELLRSRVGRYSLFESHTLAQVEAAVADGTVQDMIDRWKQFWLSTPLFMRILTGTGFWQMEIRCPTIWFVPSTKRVGCACTPVTELLQVFFSGMQGRRNIIR